MRYGRAVFVLVSLAAGAWADGPERVRAGGHAGLDYRSGSGYLRGGAAGRDGRGGQRRPDREDPCRHHRRHGPLPDREPAARQVRRSPSRSPGSGP